MAGLISSGEDFEVQPPRRSRVVAERSINEAPYLRNGADSFAERVDTLFRLIDPWLPLPSLSIIAILRKWDRQDHMMLAFNTKAAS